jgi:ribosomal 50S subunit-recycling heat shock protein
LLIQQKKCQMNNNVESVDLEEELYEHFKFEVPKGQAPLRIDKYLMGLIQNATRNKIQIAATEGNIFVNDSTVKSNYKVKAFDVVRVMLTHPPFENHIVPENIPLDIVYEDDTLLLINKKPGMVVHPGHGNYSRGLLALVAAARRDCVSRCGPFRRPFVGLENATAMNNHQNDAHERQLCGCGWAFRYGESFGTA